MRNKFYARAWRILRPIVLFFLPVELRGTENLEDEAAIRQILTMHLTLVGHAVREAEDAAAARVMIAKKVPDLAQCH